LIVFWEKAFTFILKKYLKKVIFVAHELKNCFTFGKFTPQGFGNIMKHLINQKVFIFE
jgi:hypothetical protein